MSDGAWWQGVGALFARKPAAGLEITVLEEVDGDVRSTADAPATGNRGSATHVDAHADLRPVGAPAAIAGPPAVAADAVEPPVAVTATPIAAGDVSTHPARPPPPLFCDAAATPSTQVTTCPANGRDCSPPHAHVSIPAEDGNTWMNDVYKKLHMSLNDAMEKGAEWMDGQIPHRRPKSLEEVEEEAALEGDLLQTPRAEWEDRLVAEREKWDATEYTHVGALLYDLREKVKAAMLWARPDAYPELHNTLTCIYSEWDLVEESAFGVAQAAPHRDADPTTPGNGYRSLLWVVEASTGKLVCWINDATVAHRKLIFPAGYYSQHVKEYTTIFHTLRKLLQYAVLQNSLSGRTALFLPRSEAAMERETIEEISHFDCSCFYGRKVAFYHLPPLRKAFHLIVSAMAGYGEGFHQAGAGASDAVSRGGSGDDEAVSPKQLPPPAGAPAAAAKAKTGAELLASARSVVHGMHCFLSHTQRAESVVKRFRTCNIPFAKGFWNLTETAPMASQTGAVVGPWLTVNEELKVPITEAALLVRFDDGPAAPHLHRALTCDLAQLAAVETELADLDRGHQFFCQAERDQLARVLKTRRRAARRAKRQQSSSALYGGASTAAPPSAEASPEASPSLRPGDPSAAPTSPPLPEAQSPAVQLTGGRANSFDSAVSAQNEADESWASEIARRLAAFGGNIEQEHGLGYVKTQLLAYTGPNAAGAGDRRGLVIHIHGGGFVAQSPRSHESYLRWWTKHLGVPILSIDYSLAPEAWFPRAVNECYHVYKWALENRELLGAGRNGRVVLTGDSAGGNLVVAVTLKAIMKGDRRPDGVVCSYPVLNVKLAASPSRMLALMDALLPLGLLECCLEAYIGNRPEAADDPLFSPLTASDELLKQLPPIRIVACELDPLLDDSVVFTRRLLQLGLDAKIEVITRMPHGFLNLAYLGGGDDALAASGRVVQHLHELLLPETSFDDEELTDMQPRVYTDTGDIDALLNSQHFTHGDV